jgi:biopolymer transport protein ExbD
MSSKRVILFSAALFTVALGSAACGSREHAASAPGAQSAGAEGLRLRIKQGGQYFVADEPHALTAEQLAQRLKSEDPARFGKSIYVLGDPGISGYDVVLATNAAGAAGFTRAAGIANYREDAGKGARLDTWEVELHRPSPNQARDTAPRK